MSSPSDGAFLPAGVEPAISRPAAPWRPGFWVLGLGLAGLWIDLFRVLAFTWASNDQYSYGWVVPFLAAGVAYRRCQTLPAATPFSRPSGLRAALILAGALLLPLRLVLETNPDWPLVAWAHALGVVGITFGIILHLGGWTWVRHLAFPVLFPLVAIQWPYRLEQGLIQGLMRVVAAVAVESLDLMGIPAVQRGNLVEIEAGLLGIDEACSGIRSFQTTIMATLFLAELKLLPHARRWALLGLGIGVAFALNVARAITLSLIAARVGMKEVDRWHDSAGLAIVVLCFFAIWGLAHRMARGDVSDTATPVRSAAWMAAIPVPSALAWIAAVIPLTLMATTFFWYLPGAKADRNSEHLKWSVTLPSNEASFSPIRLPERSLELLACDHVDAGEWMHPGGIHVSAFFLQWTTKSMTTIVKSRYHRPDICLPAAGATLVARNGIRRYPGPDGDLAFSTYEFAAGGERIFVFFSIQQSSLGKDVSQDTIQIADRLTSVVNRRRIVPQQTLQVFLRGVSGFEVAEETLRSILPGLVSTAVSASAAASR